MCVAGSSAVLFEGRRGSIIMDEYILGLQMNQAGLSAKMDFLTRWNISDQKRKVK